MKRYRLKKKVKVITALLSFAMLFTAIPSMKLVAEDDTSVNPEYTDEVSVGPFISYQAQEESNDINDFTTLEMSDDTMAVDAGITQDPVTNKDGSLTYNNSVTVDKTISKGGTVGSGTDAEDFFKLTLKASVNSVIVNRNAGADIILMLDMSKYMTDQRVTALKTAVNNFISEVNRRSPESRIAIVRYSSASTVLSGTGNAEDGALVTVHDDGKTNLTGIVNALSTDNNGSYCDLAMFDALKIFQSANFNEDTDSLGQEYRNRTRVAILFTAGLPGEGKGESGENTDLTGWRKSARNSAQAAMSISSIIKGTRFGKVPTVMNSNVASGDSWGTMIGNYTYSDGDSLANENKRIGCGATVYSVGLNLPNADDPATITDQNTLENFAQYNSADNYKFGSYELKESTRKSALVNEYLYRVSSHRLTGEHFEYANAEESFQSKYNSLQSFWCQKDNSRGYVNVQNLYSNMYYLYPDCITRNLENGYYLTANDDNLERLNEIFTQIAQQTGQPQENLVIRDYIDSGFAPVDDKGNQLGEGAKIGTTENGKYQGILKKDTDKNVWYIEWTGVELSPGDSKQQGAKTFEESIYVKRADDNIGGNNLYTNTTDSGIYVGDGTTGYTNQYPFPQPTVDLPIKYDFSGEDKNIYLTNGIDLKDLISNLPNGTNNKGVDITYTFKANDGTSTEYSVPAGRNADTFNNLILDNDQSYKISCNVNASITGTDHSESNSHHYHSNTVENKEIKGKKAQIYVYKPELKYEDLESYYGDSKPYYPNALTDTVWKHGSDSADVKKMGNAPGLTLSYADCSINSSGTDVQQKNDYSVNVIVKIGERDITNLTTFVHENCNNNIDDSSLLHNATDTSNGSKAFIVHVKTCSLTVTKKGGKDGEPYVFTVNKKNGSPYTTTVTITGNGSVTLKELPVGAYGIAEDSSWSWRYTPEYSAEMVTLKSGSDTGSITCTNRKKNEQWLNSFSTVVQNVFVEAHNVQEGGE